jgi:oxidase EvaA
LTSTLTARECIETSFLRSALIAEGKFLSGKGFAEWFREQSTKVALDVRRIPFAALDKWSFNDDGHLAHASGKFFSVVGVHIETDFGPVREWEQPIINQPEIGILGIITKVFDGQRYFLMQAKMEPGTVNVVQLAPTLQATRSNFTRVHKGNTPLYLDYFTDRTKAKFLVDQVQSEQASRFLFKRNRNMVIEVLEEVPLFDGFCWLTLGQIKNLLRYDNLVNMDARSVLACVPLTGSGSTVAISDLGAWGVNEEPTPFAGALYRSALARESGRHSTAEILSWLTELKSRYERSIRILPLDRLHGWTVSENDIHRETGEYFSVIAVNVRAEGREVSSWTQPLLEHPGRGLNGFIVQRWNGVLHLLVRACMYPGNRDTFELSSTVSRSDYRKQFANPQQPPFLDLFRNPLPEQIRYSSIQSEEGGRFYHYQNHYIILELPESEMVDCPENYMWMTVGQIQELVKHGYFNIEARNLLACLNLLGVDPKVTGQLGYERKDEAPHSDTPVVAVTTDFRKNGIAKDVLPSPTFCILPWTHLFADEMGVLYPCCFGLDADTPNVDSEGEPHVVYSPEGVKNGWNSGFMRGIRKDMLAGRRPAACRLCFRYEDLGMVSYRQNANEDYSNCFEQLAELDPEGWAAPEFRSVDLRLGNLCNLRCRMCSPKSSKALVTEWAQLLDIDRSRLDKFNHVDWYARQEFWELLERHAPNVERFMFAGGEPLLVRQHFEFLERLIARGKARRVHLSYITNATTLPAQIYDTWPQFLSVRLVISLDGFGVVNEFIRYPTKWDVLHRNLMTLDERADELNIREMGFNTTVQAYNVLTLPELFEYTFTFRRIKPYPDLSILNFPSCFSVQILPQQLKQKAADRLNEFRKRYEGRWPKRGRSLEQFERKIDGLIEHMMAVDRREEIPDFIRRNAVFDQHRGQEAKMVLPELRSLFETADSHRIPIGSETDG